MQTDNRPEIHAGHGTHGIPVDGFGTCGHGLGETQNVAAGKRDPAITEERGKEELTLWQMMHPAAGRINGNQTLFSGFRLWLRRRKRDDLSGVRT